VRPAEGHITLSISIVKVTLSGRECTCKVAKIALLRLTLDSFQVLECGWCSGKMPKSLKVDRKKFEGIVQNLLNSKPVKRSEVKVSKRKPEKLIPPQR